MDSITDGTDVQAGAYGQIIHDTWRLHPELCELLLNGVLGDLVRCALGDATDPVLFQDLLVNKLPGSTAAVNWHQDYSYWPLASPVGITAWVALDDTDVDNGCLHYLAGSQHRGELQPADFVVGAAQPARTGLPPLRVDSAPVPVSARAGDLVLHHPLVLHMSPPNSSRRPRRAWSITWVTPEARWDPKHAAHPYVWSLNPEPGAPLDRQRFPQLFSPAATTHQVSFRDRK